MPLTTQNAGWCLHWWQFLINISHRRHHPFSPDQLSQPAKPVSHHPSRKIDALYFTQVVFWCDVAAPLVPRCAVFASFFFFIFQLYFSFTTSLALLPLLTLYDVMVASWRWCCMTSLSPCCFTSYWCCFESTTIWLVWLGSAGLVGWLVVSRHNKKKGKKKKNEVFVHIHTNCNQWLGNSARPGNISANRAEFEWYKKKHSMSMGFWFSLVWFVCNFMKAMLWQVWCGNSSSNSRCRRIWAVWGKKKNEYGANVGCYLFMIHANLSRTKYP